MARPKSPPTYCRLGNYARTKVDGKWVSLGRWNSDESLRRFEEVRRQWRAGSASGVTSLDQLAAAWFDHIEAEGMYRRKDGTPTRETDSWRLSLEPAIRLHGSEAARDFSPKKLKAVRQAMLEGTWLTDAERASRIAGAREVQCSRKTANQRVGRIVRLFEFGVSEELVPVEVFQALQSVSRLSVTDVPIEPVSDQDIRDTLPLLEAIPRALALLQLATGMRPGEVCAIERADIDTTGLAIGQRRLWVYRPGWHKTANHGIARQIAFGPAAQMVLAPFMKTSSRWLFESRTRAGETVHYHPGTYSQQILAAARDAGVPDWQPNRLRKTAATDIEARLDLEHARATLGHTSTATTKRFYAKADLQKAAESAAKLG